MLGDDGDVEGGIIFGCFSSKCYEIKFLPVDRINLSKFPNLCRSVCVAPFYVNHPATICCEGSDGRR